MTRTTAQLIGGLGRTLIGAGGLVLAFVVFQLWGTGVTEARAQDELADQFRQRLATAQADGAGAAAAATVVTGAGATPEAEPGPRALRPEEAPKPGEAIGQLSIPAIDVSKTIVEGTTRDILRSGPGHYRATPLPGQPGNAAIAGHRTTHGAPFHDLDRLRPGDEIHVSTLQGAFTYIVEGHDDGAGNRVGHVVVAPSEVGVIADKGDDRLTLTACHPKYSAAERIVVTATLVTPPAPSGADLEAPPDGPPADELAAGDEAVAGTGDGPGPGSEVEPGPGPATGLDDTTVARSLGWQPAYAGPTAAWAGVSAAIGAAAWLLGRRWRRWPAFAMALPPLGLALFTCFSNLDRFLPAV